jgi:uroporphyrin-3 C-methyltransferase
MENTVENTPEQPVIETSPATVAEKKSISSDLPDSSNKEKKGPGWIIVLLILVVSVIAALGSAYVWQLYNEQQKILQNGQAGIAGAIQRVDEQANQNRLLQRQLDRQSDNAKLLQQQLVGQVEALQRQLSSQQKRINSLSTTDRSDWLLAEAEYLMRLANQRLLMGKEVKGALDLMMAADEIALELDDAALYPVRQELANDIAKLRSATKLDIEGVYLQLGALAKQVDQLRLFELPQLQLKTAEPIAPENWQQRMEIGLQAAWNKLSSYIQIHRNTEVYKPLLAPEYESAVRQNVRLMFEQAQMAALSGKQHLYDDSLIKAKTWLQNYYKIDADKTAELIATIDGLANIQITVPLPDISGSLRALKDYLETIRPISSNSKQLTVEESDQ